jgi:hypothetical protein
LQIHLFTNSIIYKFNYLKTWQIHLFIIKNIANTYLQFQLLKTLQIHLKLFGYFNPIHDFGNERRKNRNNIWSNNLT